MLKRLAILGLLLPLAAVWVLAAQEMPKGTPKEGIAKQEPGKKGQEQSQAQPNNQPTPKPTPTAAQPAAPTADKSSQNSSEDQKIQRWLMYFTGALVVVGVLQFSGMIWQAWLLRQTRGDVKRQADWMETQAGHMASQVGLMKMQLTEIQVQRKQTVEEMRRQAYQMEQQASASNASARAAQASADAALKTVQVMIDSERPWLVAHFKGENESCLLENGNMRLKWEVKNVGKNPAKLIEAGARLVLDTIEPGWTNPSDFGHIDSLDGRILVPGDSVSFYVFWSKTEDGIVRTATGKRREDFNDLVVGYGFVRYRSTVGEGEDLIARFCECASIDAGVISGPFDIWEFAGEEYLRCT